MGVLHPCYSDIDASAFGLTLCRWTTNFTTGGEPELIRHECWGVVAMPNSEYPQHPIGNPALHTIPSEARTHSSLSPSPRPSELVASHGYGSHNARTRHSVHSAHAAACTALYVVPQVRAMRSSAAPASSPPSVTRGCPRLPSTCAKTASRAAPTTGQGLWLVYRTSGCRWWGWPTRTGTPSGSASTLTGPQTHHPRPSRPAAAPQQNGVSQAMN
jgi:hypothetical protein